MHPEAVQNWPCKIVAKNWNPMQYSAVDLQQEYVK